MAPAPTEPVVPVRVLVIDDEKNIRTTLRAFLEALGCTVAEAHDSESALEQLRRSPADLAFLDLRLGQQSGLDLIPRLLEERPALDLVFITAYATFETAVEAIRRGAKDYLPKPFTPAQIQTAVERHRGRRQLETRLTELQEQVASAVPEVELQTASPAMQAAIDVVTRAAAHDVSVLLRGESGTGKGVLARLLHGLSPRRARPFVTVNCPTLTEELLASELFGHARGAFTGAVRDQPGRVEAAEGGTLFLDEVGELTPSLQARLLRFLQEKAFERVGENRTRIADVRVVAATNRDLDAEVKAGRFREDLLFRLNVIEVVVPPLRERLADLPRLARSLLAFVGRSAGKPNCELSKEAEAALLAHPWPGNVRELRNALERAVILASGPLIGPELLPGRIAAHTGPTLGGDFTVEQIEREHILRVLGRCATQDEAAKVLGLDASTLWRKRKKYGQ
jgi:NtrC-family two-component system response regulator AlgB